MSNIPAVTQDLGGKDVSLPFYANYAQPLWVQLEMLVPGDVVVVQTQSNLYYIFVIGPKYALVYTESDTTENRSPKEVILYGSYDLELGEPAWGKFQVGAPILFAPPEDASNATRTSPVDKIYLQKVVSRALVPVAGAKASLTNAMVRSGNVVKPGVMPPTNKSVGSLDPQVRPSVVNPNRPAPVPGRVAQPKSVAVPRPRV